ncbi:X-Pro dipeptidyl-peptidase-domain-containing protein [Xylariales sp. PMI_506]|nr:X-Pro dipeptidyl-peptidase-domain-containing protein [Xylariales sp. PMI_506]
MASADASETSEAFVTANLAKILPPEESTYVISGQQIPMPDGIDLAADLYRPDLPAGRKPHGLLYVLTPYGRKGVMAMINAKCFALRGYMVLLVSCRGTAGSGGTFVSGMSEQADSQAIVKWMREQPWYPGKFATFGASYLGYAQWALLRDPPADLVASMILCSVYDHSQTPWTHGAYRADRISWAYIVARQDEINGNILSVVDPRKLKAVIESMPLYDATKSFFEGRAQYQLEFMTHPDPDDPFWAPCKHRAALDLVNVPLLLRSGWYDTMTANSLTAYARARERGVKAYLTIGPWSHIEASGSNAMPEVFEFMEEHVAGRTENHRADSLRVFVTGAEEWRSLPSWPPATEERTFYLHGDLTIGTETPAGDAPAASFIYDPNNPTPTLGGPRTARGGRVDDSVYATRSDVIVYTSAPLQEDIEIMGKPIVQLAHSTNIPYADLWIRLSEVDADGVSHNLTESWQALDGLEKQGDVFTLALSDRGHVFKTNTCIRVIVAGGSFPLMARNPGTGVNRTLAKEMKAVTHTVEHGSGISKLILPCSA